MDFTLNSRWHRWLRLLATVLMLNATPGGGTAIPSVLIFGTGFEANQGYTSGFSLAGQDGWVYFGGTLGNGNGVLDSDFAFPGYGQSAFVGFFPPGQGVDTLNVWRPVNISPIASNLPIVRFSVLMKIVDSSNGSRDDFRWSVYNTNQDRLLTLDFDNATTNISYALDDGLGFQTTGFKFVRSGEYQLEITMNFGRNLWSASLNDTPVVVAKPITTHGAPLNLGDVDAVWFIYNTSSPGNNYMAFENYQITAEPAFSTTPQAQAIGRQLGGGFSIRLTSEPVAKYAIEATTNMLTWSAISTNSSSTGTIDFVDSQAPAVSRRFYRARLVSP